MPDLTSIAKCILRDKNLEINSESTEMMVEELEKCRKGRKVQILLLLENNQRMTTLELCSAMGVKGTSNIAVYAKRLSENLLIRKYDGSEFMPIDVCDMRTVYHSLTDYGLELISDLGKD